MSMKCTLVSVQKIAFEKKTDSFPDWIINVFCIRNNARVMGHLVASVFPLRYKIELYIYVFKFNFILFFSSSSFPSNISLSIYHYMLVQISKVLIFAFSHATDLNQLSTSAPSWRLFRAHSK